MQTRVLLPVVVALLFVTACAPTRPAGNGDGAGVSGQPARKTLTLSVIQEPPHIEGFTGAAGRGGAGSIKQIVHSYLTHEDDRLARQPQLAVELPSVEKGTWTVHPDGTMDVTWRIHPNVRWHDGAPFTTNDLVFSFNVYKDPELPTPEASTLRLMQSATAPDPHTLVVRWSTTYVRAHEAPGLVPLPGHLLEETYRGDKEAFINSPLFTSGFVGLGPYKMAKWELGSHLEFARFDEYYRGRPPFDTVFVRFILDPNAMIANILSGAVDVVMPPSVDLPTAFELRQRWEGTGNQVRVEPSGRLHFLEMQFRPDVARPRNGLPNATVRQALYHATDRQGLTEVMTGGLGPIGDSWISPTEPLRAQVESAIPQFPYDLTRAAALLAQAGWTRGSDGVLVHQSGERFEGEIWARQAAAGQEKEPSIISDQWAAVGARLAPYVIPAAREADREYQALLPTAIISGNLTGDNWYQDRTHSRYIASAENRWTGRNKLGYVNPKVDQLIDALQVTIDPGERTRLHRELLQEQMGAVVVMPLYWEVVPSLLLKGVKPSPNGLRSLNNFVAWDKE